MDTHLPYHVKFIRNGNELKSNDFLKISELQHDEFNRLKSSINLTVADAIKARDEGQYECVIADFYNNSNSATADVTFVGKPVVLINFNESSVSSSFGDSLTIECFFTGLPDPNITWYKNDKVFFSADTTSAIIEHKNGSSSIVFESLEVEDAGTYKCVAKNLVGEDSKSVTIEVSGK